LQAFSKEQLLALLGCARRTRTRDWLMILVAFWHGLRASEVIALTRDAVRDGHLTVQRLKGSQRTVQPLISNPEPLLNEKEALLEFAKNVPENQRLFPVTRRTFARIVQQHGQTAGIPRHLCHPHALKHTIAMQVIHSAGIEHTRQWLGHKSISSTGEYLKVSDSDAARAVGEATGGVL